MKKSTDRAKFLYTFGIYALLAICMLNPGSLRAEPYFAVRTGFKCGQCHVNKTGGGKRTDFGNIYSQRFLTARYIKPTDLGTFTPRLSPNISIGANLRLRNTAIFEYSDTSGNTASATSFLDITEGNVYLEAQLIPDRFTLYFDQRVSPEPGTRETFGLLYGLPFNSYIKAGKLLLPYGYRLWDDNAFIREATGFTYSGPELGLEVGFEPGNFSASMAVTMIQFSGLAALVRRHARIGISWQRALDGSDTRMFGAFAGLHAGRFTLLGEIDHISWAATRQRAYFAELDFLLLRGYNLKVSYDLFDRNLDIPLKRDGQERIALGLEVFPMQFLQVSVFYYVNRFIPQNLPQNQNTAAVEVHFFF